MDPIIVSKNINFIYNKGKTNEFHALINVSLNIFPEEFVIVFGPSGCGKSTLLNVFAGLEKPESGAISVFGRDLIKMTRGEFATYHRKNVGMIYQSYNLIHSLTVLENVALPQVFVNVSKNRRERWARSLLERFGIAEQGDKIPTELSGGQQQRIGIARSIVNNPQIVLADEPVGNLDSVSAQNVLDILENLNQKEKKTIVLVTHNPEYLDYGDRIIYMKDGIITREVVNREKHKKKKKVGPGVEMVPKTPLAQIADMMRAYRGLSPEQINILIMPYKAKIFAHHFITTRNLEETRVFEEVIQRRLLGTISQEELYDILKRESRSGGVGFDKRTADKILRRVNRVIRMAFFVYQKGRQRVNESGEHVQISVDEKVEKLTNYLLMTCYYEHFRSLDEAQITRLRQAVKDRIESNIAKSGFFTSLDNPFRDGGVGFNSKTAKAITEELELILILGFGIIQAGKNQGKTTKIAGQAEGGQAPVHSPIPGSFPPVKKEEANQDKKKGMLIQKVFPHASLSKTRQVEMKEGEVPKEGEAAKAGDSKTISEMIADLQKREDRMKSGGSFTGNPDREIDASGMKDAVRGGVPKEDEQKNENNDNF